MGTYQLRWPRGAARRWLLALALSTALLPLVSSPAGAEPTIEVVQAGWDGLAASGTWTPVRLRVGGGDADMRVTVEVIAEVEVPMGPQGTPVRYPTGAYAQELVIPAGESREVTLWFPADGEPRARARLIEGGNTLAETDVPLQLARAGWPVVAVVAEAEGVDRAVRAIELPYQGLPLPLSVAALTPDALSGDPARMQALNALVVQGAVTAELTDAQRAAILAWVQGGGHLVLAGGPSAAQAARILPDGTLPIEFGTSAGTASTEALGDWLIDVADVPMNAPLAALRPTSGVILAGTEDAPLVWRTDLGSGTVTVLAVDPALEPFASWGGNTSLLRAALSAALPEQTTGELPGPWIPGWGDPSANLQWMTGTLPRGAHIGWPVVGAVLAGFALVAGPVLYLVLRRIDRRELSWLIVPAGAVVLAGALFAWGVGSSGRDLMANVASYVDVSADGTTAHQSIAASFYGPTHPHLTVPVGGDVAVRAAVGQTDLYGMWGIPTAPRTEPPFRIVEGAERRVEFLDGQYAARSILIEHELADAPRVTAEIYIEDGLLVGTVRNDSGLVLENAAVAMGTTLVRLGDLAPGQSAPVRLEPSGPIDPMLGSQSLGYLLFGEEPTGDVFFPVDMPGGPHLVIPNDPDIQRRVNLVDQMLVYSQPSMFGVPSIPLTFFGFTEDLTAPSWLVPDGHPQYSLTLIRQALNLSLPSGSFVMPSGFIPSDISEVNSPWGLNWGGSDQGSWMELRDGTATYTMRAPLPENAVVDVAILSTEQVGPVTEVEPGSFPGMPGAPVVGPGRDPAEAGVFAAYDWSRNEWVDLPAGAEHRLDGARFINENGEMRVRIQAGNTELVRFVAPTLSIEGHASEGGAS